MNTNVESIKDYAILFMAASLLSYLFTPLAARAARGIGAVVSEDKTMGASDAIPVLGGLAVLE